MYFILALLLSGSTSFAQLVGNDLPYRVREIGNYRYIYSTEYENVANDLIGKNNRLTEIYEKEYNWRFDEDAVLAIASSQNQIANANVRQVPRLLSFFYNGGPQFIDQFAYVSWSDELLFHESVHYYQVNTRRGLSSTMKKIFGNPEPSFAIPFTYMITPHIFTPTFLMEGNATFNEGRFGNGGRLYSGYYRAMFLQLLKADKLSAARIINDHIVWPFGTEKYIVGGYFNSFLAEEFNPARVNSYFYTHAGYYVWPFLMNDSFKANYGEGFYPLWEKFKKHYQPAAENQKQLTNPVLTTTHRHEPFTVNGEVISFMTSTSKGLNKLCMFHKTKKQLKCEKAKLPFGRVFRHNKEWVTSAYVKTHPTERRAGLFSDGYQRIDEFNDQFVYAKKANHIVYADAKDSFLTTRVFKNGQFVSEMQSSPYMDSKGNFYYFKQDGKRRKLYKNSRQIHSISGYYGRVVDVADNGKVYFTGATRNGVSLFSWDGVQMYQEVDSDLVYDAKLLNKQEALVAEVTFEGTETKITKLASQVGAPVMYDYQHDDPEMQSAFDKTPPEKGEALDYEYSPLLEMEYNGVSPIFGYANPDGAIWSLNFGFSDPLQKYESNLILSDGGFETYSAQWLLTSKVNRLQWTFSALYDEDAFTGVVNGNTEVGARTSETDFTLRFLYPLISTPLWSSSVSFAYIYESITAKDEIFFILPRGNVLNGGLLKYDLNYSFQNSLDYSASRFIGLELAHKYEGQGSDWEFATPSYVGEVEAQWDVLWQSFISASYKAGLADGPGNVLDLENDDIPVNFDPTDFFRIGDENTSNRYYQLRKANAEYKQAIPVGLYFSKIPFGIHRVAPFYGYSEFYGSIARDTAADTLFHESYYGLEVEALLFHKITTRIKAVEVESSLGLRRQEFTFGLASDF